MAKKNKPQVIRRNAEKAARRVVRDSETRAWVEEFLKRPDALEKLQAAPRPANLGDVAKFLGAPNADAVMWVMFSWRLSGVL